MRKQLCVAGVLALAGGAVWAAQPTVEAGLRCAQIKDSLERLVCYDQAFGGAASVPQSLPAPAPAPATPAPAPVAQAAPAAPAAVAAAPAAPAPAAAADSFGSDQVRRTEKQRQADAGPTSLSAQVASLREYRQRMWLITLDNGQVWQQMDIDSLFQVGVGDTIQIEKGKLGGYRMARTSNGRSGWVRVNRVK